MTIQLKAASKAFLAASRGRRPLYRQLINLNRKRSSPDTLMAVNSVDLTIEDGSHVAVVGTNGAGKTTLMRLIAGIFLPTDGTVSVDGKVCCFLETGAGAAPSLPVRDNVMLYAALAGLGYRETLNNMDRILEFSDLKNNEYAFVEQLSFGYQQRLFITIMLEAMRLEKANVFMFDEFLVGVDKAFRQRAVDAMDQLAKPTQIVIHASHDDDLIRRTCPLTLHIEAGEVKQFGPTETVLERYRAGQ